MINYYTSTYTETRPIYTGGCKEIQGPLLPADCTSLTLMRFALRCVLLGIQVI